MSNYCTYCGVVDENYDENALVMHEATSKHMSNKNLWRYKEKKKQFTGNEFVKFSASISVKDPEGTQVFTDLIDGLKKNFKIRVYSILARSMLHTLCEDPKDNLLANKIQFSSFGWTRNTICTAKPNHMVTINYTMTNISNEDILIVGIQLGHPQPQFQMNNHGIDFEQDPYNLPAKTTVPRKVYVTFSAVDIGQYEMPIFFTFFKVCKLDTGKNLTRISVYDMKIAVQEHDHVVTYSKSPYINEWWPRSEYFVPCIPGSFQDMYKVPAALKTIFPKGLEEEALEGLKLPREIVAQLKAVLVNTRTIFEEGLSRANYQQYFHHLLWWEEVIQKINLKKYNMSKVLISREGHVYVLEVPGLAEKRPSLLRGDRVYLRPCQNDKIVFESIIKDIRDSTICLTEIDGLFESYYNPNALFNVRFIMSRVPMERMHEAVARLNKSQQECRVFPVKNTKKNVKILAIEKFYNPSINQNEEQKMAVKCIVSGTSGKAPYMVFGPPGTGKTVTIVEAIIQLVVRSHKNRIMVCTDSNMAADHVACMLLQYNEKLNINHFLLRANSQTRVWEVMPPVLYPVSNGKSYESFFSVSNTTMSSYRVVVTTLLHAAKYASEFNQKKQKLTMTHVFIDEAAQALETACLVPVTGLLGPNGQLVLSGDPQQLGPVCVSKSAKDRGLGISLMERLINDYGNLYNDPANGSNYITMLKNNFRSHRDILELPNELFYNNELRSLAEVDPLSLTNILGSKGGDRAIVFHGVNSREQRDGKSPSYFNTKELEMLQRYIIKLIVDHKVEQNDIGVIAPYVKQVYKVNSWLKDQDYNSVEVGTVEAFQGKEKRVILVTTVRANCGLLDYDAKYGLGFLVDDKRFNVTLTRAKAKAIIIGNPACLTRDVKWEKYMEKCRAYNTYLGQETEQLKRTEPLLKQVAVHNFDKFRVTELMKTLEEKHKK